jgi:hypothetical protein
MRCLLRRFPWSLLTLLVAVLALAAPSVASPTTDPAPWTSLLPGAPGGSGPDQAAECPGGEHSCVEQVEAALRAHTSALGCDHNGVFARTYLAITRAIGDATATSGTFADPAYINHFDAAFAAEYGRQWDAMRSGRAAAPAWRVAFDAADRKQVSAVGNLSLAINAHIARDMPLILERVGLNARRRVDQNKVNKVLYAAMRPMLDELAANYDPSLSSDVPGSGDELAMYQYIAGLRERAWRLAEELAAAPSPDAERAVRERIEREAHATALSLRAAHSTDPASVAARDAYCRTHWTTP